MLGHSIDPQEPGTAPAPVFYAVDLSRLRLRERWAFAESNKLRHLLSAVLERLLGIRAMCSLDDPPIESLAPFRAADADIPADARAALATATAELEALGYRHAFWHRVDDGLLHTRMVLRTFIHPSGEAIARLHHRCWTFVVPPRTTQFVELISAFDDGTFLWSTSTSPSLEVPRACGVRHYPDASPAALQAAHHAALERGRVGRAAMPLRTAAAASRAAERLHGLVRDAQVARGLFVPRTAAEDDRAAALAPRRDEDPVGDADVLAELRRAVQPRPSRTKGLLVLLASAALFFAAGAAQWSLEYVALLVPVVLVHELGHFVAMRAFGYRDVRMFFIPFFGAAVTGRRFNVPAWKQVVVSLMGPLPGIVLGGVAAGLALATSSDLLQRLALILLLVNGFNLAPFLPLDGGWVMRALVFSRHHLLDVAFVVLAAGVLIAGGMWSGDVLLTIVGVALLPTVRGTYRVGALARALRASPLPPVPADADEIPPAVAAPIIAGVRAAEPHPTARAIAAQTLAVFERLTTRAPGWTATLLLGALYAGSLVLCVAALGALAIGDRVLRPWIEPPARVAIDTLAAAPVAFDDGPFQIATFDEASLARRAYAALADSHPTTARALFGQSVLLAVPVDGAPPRATFVGAEVLDLSETFDLRVTLTCHMPDGDAASGMVDRLGAFFNTPAASLVPPWAQPDPRSAQEQAQHERARATYRRISAAAAVGAEAERREALILEAVEKREDEDAFAAAIQEYERLHRIAQHRAIADLQSAADADADPLLLALQAEWLRRIDAGDAEMSPTPFTQILARMGSIAELADRGGPDLGSQAAVSGEPSAHGTLMRIDDLRFVDPFRGPAAVATWLHAVGCRDLRYAFIGG